MLENLKLYKDNAHKLSVDQEEADRSRAALLEDNTRLEGEAKEALGELEGRQAALAQLSELLGSLQVLQARRDTTLAENARRKAALTLEVKDSTLAEMLKMQEQFEDNKRAISARKSNIERQLSDARIGNGHVRDLFQRETAKQARHPPSAPTSRISHTFRLLSRTSWPRSRRFRTGAWRSARSLCSPPLAATPTSACTWPRSRRRSR